MVKIFSNNNFLFLRWNLTTSSLSSTQKITKKKEKKKLILKFQIFKIIYHPKSIFTMQYVHSETWALLALYLIVWWKI